MVFLIGLLINFFPLTVHAASSIELEITEDTYIEEKYPTVVTWNNRNLYLGTDILYGKGKTRILIKPSLQLLREQDIISTDVTNAELILHQYYYEGTESTATIDSYTTTHPWDMNSVTWNQQPAISTKRDSTLISTTNGVKSINVTNSFIDVLKSINSTEKGILLKMNPETDRALVFWAHGCTIAPTSPRCESESLRPKLRVYLRNNTLPTACTFLSPRSGEHSSKAEIAFKPDAAFDNEGDKVGYTLRICRSGDCVLPSITQPISPTSNAYISLPEGEYFAQCGTDDGHIQKNWGETIAFKIDRTPPPPPVIIQEPFFTNSDANTVFWFPLSESVEYQLISSERSDFSSYNTYSSWIAENHVTAIHTKEKPYYYKVRARDKAGNLSDWSDFVSTTIDIRPPTFRYFKSNNLLMSPKFDRNGTPTENFYIQGAAEDTTYGSLKLVIKNLQNKVVYTEVENEKSYLWTHWPETKYYPDGIYSATLIAEDLAGYISESDPLLLELDSTPPREPLIVGVSNNQLTNKNQITVTSSCPDQSVGNLYSGGKIVSENKTNHTVKLKYSDGTHTLKGTCKDKAGNSSEKKISFTVDTKPPSKPSLTTELLDSNKVNVLLGCREDTRVELFINGLFHHTGSCTPKSSYLRLIQPANMTEVFSITARTIDEAGNKSDLSEAVIFLGKAKEPHEAESVTCSASIRNTDTQFNSIECNWPQESLTYIETIRQDNVQEKSIFLQHEIKDPKVYITVTSCKQRSFWDPRTWYGCVTVSDNVTTIFGKIYPLHYGGVPASFETNNQVGFTHKVTENITIQTKYLLLFSTNIGGNIVSATTTSTSFSHTFHLVKKQNTKKFFGWIFSTLVQVSQWYGKTAYDSAHSGIDFSVNKQTIIAPADGKIAAVGYHKKDECNAGGYYLGIRHDNGYYTYFFHLSSDKYPNSKKVSVGDTVKKGSKVAVSGNSGKYKCEPLLAHLHFETRTGQTPSAHVNPVPHFAIDWNTIVTAKANLYPKRLTGENPHPKF